MEHILETHEAAQALVEEVLRTGFFMIDMLGSLVDAADNHDLAGEDPAEFILRMVSGSFVPACEAAGSGVVSAATSLVGALTDRTVDDMRLAIELAEGGDLD